MVGHVAGLDIGRGVAARQRWCALCAKSKRSPGHQQLHGSHHLINARQLFATCAWQQQSSLRYGLDWHRAGDGVAKGARGVVRAACGAHRVAHHYQNAHDLSNALGNGHDLSNAISNAISNGIAVAQSMA
jgi:hypothetical protein